MDLTGGGGAPTNLLRWLCSKQCRLLENAAVAGTRVHMYSMVLTVHVRMYEASVHLYV
jgi:hypothetical protein